MPGLEESSGIQQVGEGGPPLADRQAASCGPYGLILELAFTTGKSGPGKAWT